MPQTLIPASQPQIQLSSVDISNPATMSYKECIVSRALIYWWQPYQIAILPTKYYFSIFGAVHPSLSDTNTQTLHGQADRVY